MPLPGINLAVEVVVPEPAIKITDLMTADGLIEKLSDPKMVSLAFGLFGNNLYKIIKGFEDKLYGLLEQLRDQIYPITEQMFGLLPDIPEIPDLPPMPGIEIGAELPCPCGAKTIKVGFSAVISVEIPEFTQLSLQPLKDAVFKLYENMDVVEEKIGLLGGIISNLPDECLLCGEMFD